MKVFLDDAMIERVNNICKRLTMPANNFVLLAVQAFCKKWEDQIDLGIYKYEVSEMDDLEEGLKAIRDKVKIAIAKAGEFLIEESERGDDEEGK